MKILFLTLKKKWFKLIAKGVKKEEYRDHKDYWRNRLVNKTNNTYKTFDEVHFRNGYRKNAPFMRVKCGCIFRGYRELEGVEKQVYIIELGEVLEVRA